MCDVGGQLEKKLVVWIRGFFFLLKAELERKCSMIVDQKQMELKALKKQAEEKIFGLEEQLAQVKRGFIGKAFSL